MPEETKPEPSSPTSASQQPPSEPPTGDGDEYRYPSGPFAGLTAAEAAAKYDKDVGNLNQQYNTLANQVQTYVQHVNQQAQQTQAPRQPQQIDGDLWMTNPEQAQQLFKQQLMGEVQQMGQQAFGHIYQGQASLARSNSMNDLRIKEIWDKYGNEIDGLMAQVPPPQKANKEVWDQAAKLIMANHVDEIATEKAQSLVASMPHTETGTQRSASLPEPELSAIQKIRESDYGKRIDYLTDAQIKEAATKMGHTVEEYAEMVTSTHVISHPKKPGEWVNRELVKD